LSDFSKDPILQDKLNRQKKHKVIIGSIGGVLTMSILLVLVLFNTGGAIDEYLPQQIEESVLLPVTAEELYSEDVIEASDSDQTLLEVEETEWWLGGVSFPARVPAWQTDYWQNISDLEEQVVRYIANETDLNAQLFEIPAFEHGFHNNPDEEYFYGNLDPLFSPVIREELTSFVMLSAARFVNPVFGGWIDASFGENFDDTVNEFSDLFTSEFLSEINQNPTLLPIFADWNNDDYEMSETLLPDHIRWVGVIDNSSIEARFVPNHDDVHKLYFSANATFHAWTQDQKIITKNGVLAFTVNTAVSGESFYKISAAELILE